MVPRICALQADRTAPEARDFELLLFERLGAALDEALLALSQAGHLTDDAAG